MMSSKLTYDAVRLIPRSVLFADPSYSYPQISPDGTRLGFLSPHATGCSTCTWVRWMTCRRRAR
jgi:hypothetical protein